jgi:hypothetical protein
MKIYSLKIIHLQMRKLYHQQRVTLTPRIKKKRRQKSRLLPQN